MRNVYLFLAMIVLISGCAQTTQVVGGGLVMKLKPDTKAIFAGGDLRLNVDLDNKNTKSISSIRFDVFDTGILREASSANLPVCENRIDLMKPDEFRTFWCILSAPRSDQILGNKVTTAISAKASYTTDFSSVQVIEMITQDEYIRRTATGKIETKPAKYSYKDDNIQLDVEFSDQLPLIVRPGKRYFAYFTIRNIGNGFTTTLNREEDFIVEPVSPESPRIVDCNIPENPAGTIEAVGKEFPRITCKIEMPGNVQALENYGLLIVVKYNYEVRESVNVDIVR